MTNSHLVNTFINLVKIDSPSSEEQQLSMRIYKLLKNKVDVIKFDQFGNLYAKIVGQTGSVFLSAHMDTVEPGKNINPRISNGFIVSDKTTVLGGDNKIAIACIIELIYKIAQSNIKHKTIECIFTRSEEVGNYGAINFDYHLLESKVGYCFDSSNPVGSIIIASPFYERFDLKIIGKSAHPSKQKESISALLIFKDLLNQIKIGKINDNTLVNIGVINGGRVRNTVLGEIDLKGEIRSLIEKKLLDYKKIFINTLESITKKYEADFIVDFVRENSGYKYLKSDLVELCDQIKISGFVPNPIISWGVSDANIFNEKGLICFNLGDGGEFSHTLQERIKISEMNNLLHLMQALIK